jgi:hypothetical protein
MTKLDKLCKDGSIGMKEFAELIAWRRYRFLFSMGDDYAVFLENSDRVRVEEVIWIEEIAKNNLLPEAGDFMTINEKIAPITENVFIVGRKHAHHNFVLGETVRKDEMRHSVLGALDSYFIQHPPTQKEIESFMMNNLFNNLLSVRGKTEGELVTLDTPCHDCFHADIDGIDLCIGKPLAYRFGLASLGVEYGVPNHSYVNLGTNEKAFYEKHSKEEIGTAKNTIRNFAETIYDLTRIKSGLSIS